MPVNATYAYSRAEAKYLNAKTHEEKLVALQEMLREAPSHKGAETLRSGLKQKISKLKEALEKNRIQSKKTGASSFLVKKEGAAQVVIVGPTNVGKSTLLKELTNAQVLIADYPYTTKKPEMGTMDYRGVKLQIVEIPALFKNFSSSPTGPSLLSIIRQSDLILLMFNTPEEKLMLDDELRDIEDVPRLIFNDQKNLPDLIWEKLGLIKAYTKQPGKKKDMPPIAFDKGATVKDLAKKIHKDFLKKFKYARIFGPSAKFDGQTVGLTHVLKDEDAVELHIK